MVLLHTRAGTYCIPCRAGSVPNRGHRSAWFRCRRSRDSGIFRLAFQAITLSDSLFAW